MAFNFPNAPTVGQVYNVEGMTFIWTGSIWQFASSDVAEPATIITSGFPTFGWQIWGDLLICAGTANSIASAVTTITFQKEFKTTPIVVATANNTQDINITAEPFSSTQARLRAFATGGGLVAGSVPINWVAIGEAKDVDKLPKVVQTIGGLASFATDSEAKAGTATDKVMSPANTRAAATSIEIANITFNGVQYYEFDVPPECYGFEYDFIGFLPSVNPQALLMQFGDASGWPGGATDYVNAQMFMASANTLQAATTNYFGAFLTTNIDVPNGDANAGWGRVTGFNWPTPRWAHLNGSSMGVTRIGGNPAFEQKADASVRCGLQKIWTRARFMVGSGVINSGSAIVRGLLK